MKYKNILLDIRNPFLGDSSVSSTSVYGYNLLINLLNKKTNFNFFLITNNKSYLNLEKKNSNLKVIFTKINNPIIFENILMPYYAFKYKIDIIHFTKSSTTILPLFFKKKISTVHGLIYKIIPEKSTWYENLYWRIIAKLTYIFTKKIIVVSNTDKNDLINDGCNPNKIEVINIGISNKFFKEKSDMRYLKEFNLIKGKYFIQIGGISKKKNQKFTLNVIKDFLRDNKYYKFLIIGPVLDKEYKENLDKYISKYGLTNQVIFTGGIDQNTEFKKFISLIDNSFLAFFPSIYEGFGIPPLEIISRGIPVLISNKGSLPEIYGKNNTFELNDKVWKEQFEKLVFDTKYRKKFYEQQLKILKKYKWENIVNKYIDLYNSL